MNNLDISDETYKLFEEAYKFFNNRLFDDSLPKCLITFQRQNKLMGYVSFNRWKNDCNMSIDELAINPEYFANFPLIEILRTLCHEMVHVWQSHFGSPSRNGYHNQEWANKMIFIGLMPSSTGQEGGSIVGQSMLDYQIEGGKFDKASKELLAQGFKLIWFDTVSIEPTSVTRLQNAARSNSTFEKNTVPQCVSSETTKDIELGVDMNAFEAAFEESTRNNYPSKIITTRPKTSSYKTKYFCSQCFAQVWGKPNLKILCGTCTRPFIEDS